MRGDTNEGEESKVSINGSVVSWHDSYIRPYSYADISVAAATGLITQIINGSDLKGLRAMSSEVKDLANRPKG